MTTTAPSMAKTRRAYAPRGQRPWLAKVESLGSPCNRRPPFGSVPHRAGNDSHMPGKARGSHLNRRRKLAMLVISASDSDGRVAETVIRKIQYAVSRGAGQTCSARTCRRIMGIREPCDVMLELWGKAIVGGRKASCRPAAIRSRLRRPRELPRCRLGSHRPRPAAPPSQRHEPSTEIPHHRSC